MWWVHFQCEMLCEQTRPVTFLYYPQKYGLKHKIGASITYGKTAHYTKTDVLYSLVRIATLITKGVLKLESQKKGRIVFW